MLGNGGHDVFLRDIAELDERVLKFGAGLLLQGFRFADLVLAEEAFFHEHIGKIATAFGHRKDLRSKDNDMRVPRLRLSVRIAASLLQYQMRQPPRNEKVKNAQGRQR